MALTPSGYPYPTGSDKVVDGDNAIRALAEAIPIAQVIPVVGAPAGPTVDAYGVINFTAINIVNIPSCFIAGFSKYRITIHLDACSAQTEILMQVVDNTGVAFAGTVQVRNLLDNNTSVVTTQAAGTVGQLVAGNVGAAGALVIVDLVIRQGVVNTAAWMHAKSFQPSGAYQRHASGYVPPLSGKSWAGVLFNLGASATMTGRITIEAKR